MRALYIYYSSSVCMKSRFTPRSAGTPPSYFPISCTSVESKSIPADVNAHFTLLTQAVGREAINAGANQSNCNKSCCLKSGIKKVYNNAPYILNTYTVIELLPNLQGK